MNFSFFLLTSDQVKRLKTWMGDTLRDEVCQVIGWSGPSDQWHTMILKSRIFEMLTSSIGRRYHISFWFPFVVKSFPEVITIVKSRLDMRKINTEKKIIQYAHQKDTKNKKWSNMDGSYKVVAPSYQSVIWGIHNINFQRRKSWLLRRIIIRLPIRILSYICVFVFSFIEASNDLHYPCLISVAEI